MKILIPPSEGKAKVKPTKTLFGDTNFKFNREVKQVVRLLELIGDEDLRSVYGTSAEKSLMFHRQNQIIGKVSRLQRVNLEHQERLVKLVQVALRAIQELLDKKVTMVLVYICENIII